MEAALQPLLERPGDPATLRVVSDALLEQGDPWGEAIRLALDLERTFPGEDAHRLGHRRLERLEATHGASWKARVRGPPPARARANVDFFRGVPSQLSSTEPALARLLEGPVASLAFSGADLVLSWPRRAGLVDVKVETYVEDAVAARLLASGLPSLRSLALRWNGDPTLELLEQASCTPQLEQLRLSARGVPVSAPQLERLLKLPLPKLRALALEGLALGQPGAERLAAMPWKLERLTLAGAGFGVKGTVALAASPALESVRELSLAQNAMGPAGAQALATSPRLRGLVSLVLSSTASGAKALLPFFEALSLPALKALRLSSCGLKGKALGPFAAAKSKALSQLTLLDLSGNLMGDEGLAALSKTKSLTNVRVLDLAGNAVKGPGLAALGKSPLLAQVEELSLPHNKFQNAGAKGLATSTRMGELRRLTLGHNWLGVQGLKAVLANPALERLEEVREGTNNYGSELARSFAASKTLRLWKLGLGLETTTDALERLLASPRVATLELLLVFCDAFDDERAAALVKGPLGKGATTVVVSRAWCKQLTDAGAQTLAAALGPRVTFD